MFFGKHEVQVNDGMNMRPQVEKKRSKRGSHAALAIEFDSTASRSPTNQKRTRRGSFTRLGFSKPKESLGSRSIDPVSDPASQQAARGATATITMGTA